MRFVVLLEDEPSKASVRPQLMPQHLKYLGEHPGEILEAGPLSDTDAKPAGGLWIVEADGADTVKRLVEADPFYAAGLRRSVRILSWKRVFAGGKVLI